MKVKININNSEKEIVLSGFKAKDKRSFIRKIGEIGKKAKENSLEAIGEMDDFLDFQDNMLLEHCDLKKEDYDELDLEEANKLLLAMRKILGFEGENPFF